jgi:hypothetical protein
MKLRRRYCVFVTTEIRTELESPRTVHHKHGQTGYRMNSEFTLGWTSAASI